MDALRIGPRLRGTVCPLSQRPFYAVSSIPGARSRYLYTLQARHLLEDRLSGRVLTTGCEEIHDRESKWKMKPLHVQPSTVW